jgi:hypothetical protein
LAKRDGITRRYIRRLVGLAFLSLQLVEAILQGRQSVELTATRLTEFAYRAGGKCGLCGGSAVPAFRTGLSSVPDDVFPRAGERRRRSSSASFG